MREERRNLAWDPRGEMDDWAAGNLLSSAKTVAQGLLGDFPNLRDELDMIIRSLDEQLARFS